MIRELSLASWRNFDALELSLHEGTNFITARNAVGKTSVIQAIEWAVFGNDSQVDAVAAIRKGAASALVRVVLDIGNGDDLVIERTVASRAQSVTAKLRGQPITEDELKKHISNAYGGMFSDLARLSFVPAGAIADYTKEQFYLRRHLCRLYGIDQLQGAADKFDNARRHVASQLRKVKTVRAATVAELDAMRLELGVAETAVADAQGIAAQAVELVAAARAAAAAATSKRDHLARRAAYESQLVAFTERVQTELGLDVGPDAAVQAVRDAAAQADADIEGLVGRKAGLQARRHVVTATSDQLHTTEGDCPVCRRPLEGSDLEAAERWHAEELERIEQELAAASGALAEARRVGIQLRQLAEAAVLLVDPGWPPEETSGGDLDTTEADVAAAVAAHAAAAESIGRARSAAETLRAQLVEAERIAEEQEVATTLYAQEAIVSAATTTFAEVTKQLIEEQIDPLSREVARRWKLIFAGRRAGLTLDSDGRLFLEREGHEIPFEDMSAGERAIAIITTRLLVLSVTSRSGFACFDEPLEQLDPLNRRTVALLLAQASPSAVRQLIVTTFEEALAHRLGAAIPTVHVESVTVNDLDVVR